MSDYEEESANFLRNSLNQLEFQKLLRQKSKDDRDPQATTTNLIRVDDTNTKNNKDSRRDIYKKDDKIERSTSTRSNSSRSKSPGLRRPSATSTNGSVSSIEAGVGRVTRNTKSPTHSGRVL